MFQSTTPYDKSCEVLVNFMSQYQKQSTHVLPVEVICSKLDRSLPERLGIDKSMAIVVFLIFYCTYLNQFQCSIENQNIDR